ncbi:MAG: hypothetical protein ABFC89_10835 [Methanospirillum sp.]
MANFVQKSITKSATRVLTTPIADVSAFTEVVDDIIANNPFGCTPYESAGQSMPAVEKTREAYTARVVYENGEAQTVGTVTARCPTVAALHRERGNDPRERSARDGHGRDGGARNR